MRHVFDVESHGQSHAGLIRELNEDRYLVKSESGLFVVADGMGGHDAGEVASSSIVEHLKSIGIPSSAPDLRARFETLSPRERQVMALVTAGRMNKQVAGELSLSEITVKIHRGSAMRKMGAKTLADLVRMAEALHLTPGQGVMV